MVYGNGKIKNIHYGDILVKYSTIKNVNDDDVPYLKSDICVAKTTDFLSSGDVVMADTAEDYLVGKTIEVLNSNNVKVVSGLHTIALKPKIQFANGFLGFYFNSNRFKRKCFPLVQGIKVYGISKSALSSLFISYPTLEEQQKISCLLKKIDLRIVTQNKIIEENKTLKNQLTETLIYGSSDATCVTLSDYCGLKNGYPFKSDCYVEGGKYSIITIGNVQGNRFLNMDGVKTIKSLPLDIQEHQILRKGDILISLTGNVGRVSIVDKDNCLLNQRVGLLTFNNPTITEYVFQCLSSHKFELEMAKKGQGAAQLNIGNNDVISYKIPISRNNTDSIAKVLKKIDEKIIIEVKLKKLFSEQKKYLLDNLFI